MPYRQVHREPHDAASAASSEWYQDCVVITALLAATLEVRQMRRLLRKHGHDPQADQLEPDQALEALHGACHQDPTLRSALTKLYNARFRATVAQVAKLAPEAILAEAQERPWTIPHLWACYQHPDPQARQVGRRLAHLAMWRGLASRETVESVQALTQRAQGLASQNQALRDEQAKMQKELKELRGQMGRLCQERPQPSVVVTQSSPQDKKTIRALRQELAKHQEELKRVRQQMAVWRSMALKPEEHAEPEPALQARPDLGVSQIPCDHCDLEPACPRAEDCPLRGRRVAVVGGLERMEKEYRQTVAKLGGECLYHHGHTQSGPQALRNLVDKSDLVVCITSVNSHGAMNVIKKQCKRCRKPFCPLPCAGASRLEGLLREAAADFLASNV